MSEDFHIAQANIALMRASLDDPIMAEFSAWLEPINALADSSPGFVWRLQTEDGDATSVRAFSDPLVLFNMSVWNSVESLEQYVYQSDHVRAFQERKSWFDGPPGPTSVLWWVRAGDLPVVDGAIKKFELLRERGPTPLAFTFGRRFPAPGASNV